MITKYNKLHLYLYLYIYLYKFKKNFLLVLNKFNKKLVKINKKKNLFFKKKFRIKVLVSKRLTIVLKKRKKLKKFKKRKPGKGNFFFKKFFFKTLLRSRKFIKSFFFLPKKIRQTEISKKISKNKKYFFEKNTTYEFTLLNTLLRSHFCLFIADALNLIKCGGVYINGISITKYDILISECDLIQIKIDSTFLRYIRTSKKFLKKKIALFRFNSWKWIKQKLFKKKTGHKFKKRKTPKYIYLFFLYKLNVPKFLEVDYLTLSIFFLKKLNSFEYSTYYLNKLFSFKLFSLYNFKKIN